MRCHNCGGPHGVLCDGCKKEENPPPGYSDDRLSLAQEIYRGLKQRGYYVPKWQDRAGPDLINAIFMALESPRCECGNKLSTECHLCDEEE